MILVLEDMSERVEWLRSEFPSRAVCWSTTVNGFFDFLKEKEPSLMVMDHDLGADVSGMDMGMIFPRDLNGMCGMDAVDQLPEKWRHVPIIVWSINRPRAQEMVLRLKDRGFGAVHVPFNNDVSGNGNPLRRAISSVMEQMDARVQENSTE